MPKNADGNLLIGIFIDAAQSNCVKCHRAGLQTAAVQTKVQGRFDRRGGDCAYQSLRDSGLSHAPLPVIGSTGAGREMLAGVAACIQAGPVRGAGPLSGVDEW